MGCHACICNSLKYFLESKYFTKQVWFNINHEETINNDEFEYFSYYSYGV